MAISSGILCGVCEAQHISKEAEHWCPECEEGLCSDCQTHHSLSKGTRNHGIILVDQYRKLPSSISEIVKHCKDHGNKYTNYCSHHDALCCPVCIASTHRDCKGFMSIEEIIKTAKTSTLVESMEQSLRDIENNIDKVIQNREHNLLNIKQQRQTSLDDLKHLRDNINSHLDTLEQTFLGELFSTEKNVQTKIKNLINHLSKEKKSVNALRSNIETLKEHASDLQTVFGSKTYQPEVEKKEKCIKTVFENGSLEELNLKCSMNVKLLETLRTFTFGSVGIETGPPSLILKTKKDKQAQIMTVIPQPLPKLIKDIKLSLLHTVDIPECNYDGYRGCIIHPNGKMIFTDSSRPKLIVLNNDGTVDKDIPCSSFVSDVTTIDDRTVAVSTRNGIDIINIDSKQTEKVIKTHNWCNGITHHKGTLLWCEEKKGTQRMNLSDGRITTLVKQDRLPPDSYVTTHGDKIYQTNHVTQTVTCYSTKGERLWEYKNESLLQHPVGITVDSNGNIYVTSYTSDNVVAISVDGKNGKKLLSQQAGLMNPMGIYYDKSNNNVLVGNNHGPAFLYRVSRDDC